MPFPPTKTILAVKIESLASRFPRVARAGRDRGETERRRDGEMAQRRDAVMARWRNGAMP
jgi:hypothetical protein